MATTHSDQLASSILLRSVVKPISCPDLQPWFTDRQQQIWNPAIFSMTVIITLFDAADNQKWATQIHRAASHELAAPSILKAMAKSRWVETHLVQCSHNSRPNRTHPKAFSHSLRGSSPVKSIVQFFQATTVTRTKPVRGNSEEWAATYPLQTWQCILIQSRAQHLGGCISAIHNKSEIASKEVEVDWKSKSSPS
ncbi:hypothetical protein ACLOJK_037186, partial [Asimina triloba]